MNDAAHERLREVEARLLRPQVKGQTPSAFGVSRQRPAANQRPSRYPSDLSVIDRLEEGPRFDRRSARGPLAHYDPDAEIAA